MSAQNGHRVFKSKLGNMIESKMKQTNLRRQLVCEILILQFGHFLLKSYILPFSMILW